MIRKLDVSIDELTRKIEEGRVRDAEKERVRIKRHRALVQVLKARGDMAGAARTATAPRPRAAHREQAGRY